MPSNQKRFVFYADAELAAKIQGIAAETGAPVAEVIRRALKQGNHFLQNVLTPEQRKQWLSPTPAEPR
jgi:hypothetical protein